MMKRTFLFVFQRRKCTQKEKRKRQDDSSQSEGASDKEVREPTVGFRSRIFTFVSLDIFALNTEILILFPASPNLICL